MLQLPEMTKYMRLLTQHYKQVAYVRMKLIFMTSSGYIVTSSNMKNTVLDLVSLTLVDTDVLLPSQLR